MRDKTKAGSDLRLDIERLKKRVAELSVKEKELEAAVKRLRGSEELYKSLVDTSPAAVTVTDTSGIITLVSELTLKLHGYESADEMIGKSAFEMISPEDQDKAVENMKKTLEQGYVQNVEYKMLRRDGSTFIGELNAGIVRDHEGNASGFIAVVRDVTEQRSMETALRESEENYRDLVENINDTIYRIDSDGVVQYVSPAIKSVIGYSQTELVHSKITDYVYPDDIPKVAAAIRGVLDGRLSPTDVRVMTRTGEIRWIRVSSRQVPGAGAPPMLQGVLTDITERRKAEREASFLASVIGKLKDSCIVTDLNYKIVYVNDATTDLFGYEREELIGRTPDFLNAEPMAESLQKEIYDTVKSGNVWEHAIKNRRKDGSIFINEFTVSPLVDEDGEIRHYIGIQRDVTEKKRLEQELNQAQKMEAVGTMAGGIAHDFNNMLTAIIGYSQLLLDECEPESVMRKDVEEIDKTARRAAALTRRLLAFSKGQMAQMAPVDLNTIVAGLDKMLRRLIGEDLELRTNLRSDVPRVRADAGQIEQVIVNLALNSRDAMPDGGVLTVETDCVEIDKEDCVDIPEALPGRWARLTVRDTGRGMDAKVVERVFEPFYTTKEVGKGTGLGMSVVYGIVKAHKGWLRIESEPLVGTEVKIYLSIVSEDSEWKGLRLDDESMLLGRGERVLLVEDQEEVRSVAERALVKRGYEICTASDAADALKVYDREDGRFDVVFSDVVLPDRSGVDLVERIRSRDPDIAVLLTSGYTDHRQHRPAIEGKGYALLRKPYELAELARALRQVLDRTPKE